MRAVRHFQIALQAPRVGWLPFRLEFDDTVIEGTASFVLTDPLESLIELLAFAVKPTTPGPSVCFWLEPHGYILESKAAPDRSHVMLRLRYYKMVWPPDRGRGMREIIECILPSHFLRDPLHSALQAILEGPPGYVTGRHHPEERRTAYLERFRAIQSGDPSFSPSQSPKAPKAGGVASKEILFYGVADEFGAFSNFAPYPVRIDGKVWPTTEHYFQSQKFAESKVRERIRSAKTPAEAASLGRSRKLKLRRDWDSSRISVMRVALLAKFHQHDDLATLLLATGDARIVEHTDSDEFSGDGGDGSGKNMLGNLLMEVRATLQKNR